MLVWDRALSDEELTPITRYLSLKYGLGIDTENFPAWTDDGVAVPSGSTVQMGITPTNTVLSKVITITNWGATSLTVSNITSAPNPPFAVTPATIDPIPPQGFTHLTVTFNSGVTGLFTGTLAFEHNDLEDEWSSPFFLNLVARANPSGVPPSIVITNPVQGQVFTSPTNVIIGAHAQATGTSIARVEFYSQRLLTSSATSETTFLGFDTNAPFEVTWPVNIGGDYTLRAVPIDAVGRFGKPTNVTVTINNPPILARDFLMVFSGSGSNELQVLLNDRDPDGDALQVTNFTTNDPPKGTFNVTGGRLFYTPNAGEYGRDYFTYTASDGRGGVVTTNGSVMILPPWALEEFDQVVNIRFPTNNAPVTSPIVITGNVASPYLRSYQLKYQRVVYPWPAWKTFAEGDIGVTNGPLGTFDPTGLPNGHYSIKLSVEDWMEYRTREVYLNVHVGESFKVGHFTVAFNDLQIPVSGLPITLTRTYDSRDPEAGEFGAGWKLDVASARLEKSGLLGSGWGVETLGFGGLYSCVQSVPEPHLVTITFPNDQQFQFEAMLDINGRGESCVPTAELPNAHAMVTFKALPGTTGTLVPLHKPSTLDINIFSGDDVTLHEDRGDATGTYGLGPIYDPAEFLFTTLDGREFQFNAAGKVVKMTDRNGNTLTFSDDGIIHSSGKSVRFVRDTAGRITEIYDPNGLDGNGEPAGPPAVTYTYDGAGNLTHVARLTDRASTNQVTTEFLYTNATYPHYLTAIKDPRGITGIRNEYDENGRLKSHTDADGKSITYIHDINGRKETIVDRLGHTNIFNYDPKGNVTSSVNPLGHTNQFAYDVDGNMLTHTDPLGNTTTNTYDGSGNVLSVTLPHKPGENPESFTTRFTYDQFGNQTSVTLPTGATIANTFDPNTGDLLSVKAGTNVITSYTYDSVGNVTAEVDRFGTNSFALDVYGNATTFTNSLGQVITSDYDANGNLTNLVDGGNTSRLAYDAMGRETTSDYGSGITLTNNYNSHLDWTSVDAPTVGHMERHFDRQGRLGGWTTVNGSTPGFGYNGNGDLEYETNILGVVTHTTYDAAGRVIAVTNLTTGAGVRYQYDAGDRRIAETNTLGYATRFGYNPDGSLAAMTNAFGTNYWLYAYETGGGCCGGNGASVAVTDPLGRQLKTVNSEYGLPLQTIFISGANSVTNTTTYLSGMVSPDQEAEEYPATITDEGGRTRTNTYNALGQLETSTDLGGNKWTNRYDQVSGALTNILSPTGESLFYTYGELDNRKTIRFPDGNWLTNWFDAANRLASNRVPSGAVINYEYDFAGRITNRSSTLGETSAFQYNLADAVTVMTDNTGSTTNLYDAAGRRHGIDYPTGASVRYGFDLLGQVTSITNKPSNSGTARITLYAYDEHGNRTNQTDALNRRTSYIYDSLGRRIKRTLPGNQSETFGYDTAGNLIAHTNFNGLVITNQYDDLNRLVKKAAGSTVLETYAYDAAGRLTNRTDAAGSWQFVYDSRDRLKTNTGPVGSVYYAYDIAGNLITISSSTANGTVMGYYYDRLNRLTNVVDLRLTGTQNTAYKYDVVGNLATLKYPNGITNLHQYDARNRLTNLLWKASSTTLGSFAYRLDVTGKRTNLADIVNSVSRTFSWKYDSLSRLTNETVSGTAPTGSLAYKFDPVSNRTNRTGTLGSLGTANYSYNTNDWLAGDAYDSNGNTINSAGIGYQYDYANRLTNANNGGVTIVYDAQGNRIKKVGSTTTLYLVDDHNLTGYAQVLEELTVSGGSTNLSGQYTYGLDLISQRQPTTSTNFFGYDGLGSTRFLANNGGTLVNTFTYDAYGTIISGTPQTSYLFTGEQWDTDLGLYFLRARYLKPNTGRFWSMDSYEGSENDPLSLHKYLYAHANPAINLDPSGHETVGSMAIASATALALQAGYDATVVTAGFMIMNALSATAFGMTLDQMFPMIEQDVQFGDEVSYDLSVKGFGGEDILSVKAAASSAGIAIVTTFGNEQGRNALGQFIRKSAGQTQPGSTAVDDFCELARKNGFEVTREVTFKTRFGNRRYDVVLKDPKTAESAGIELKSSEGAMDRPGREARKQFAADRWINMRGGAEATGQHANIRIKCTYKIMWKGR